MMPVDRSTAATRERWIALAIFCVLALAAWMALRRGLSAFMLFDDYPQLKPLFSTLDVSNWRTSAAGFLVGNSGPLGRPVSMLTFAANAVADGDDIATWKFANVMLHLANGWVMFALTARLVARAGGVAARASAHVLAAWTAGLWLLHPMHVSTVLYTVQRMTELSTFFTLAALLAYVAGRDDIVAGRTARGRTLVLGGFLVLCPLAVLSKENGVLFPVLAAVAEYCCYRDRRGADARFTIPLFGAFLALPAAACAGYFALDWRHRVLAGYETRDFTLGQRLLTEGRVVADYLGQWVLPLPSRMPFFYDNYPVSHGLLDGPATLGALALLCAVGAVAWHLRVRAPLIAFGIFFFFFGHSLESTIFPLELVFEHRNYLPYYGLALSATLLGHAFLRSSRARVSAAALTALALCACTAWRAGLWSSDAEFYTAALRANPTSPRLLTTFAEGYTSAGRFDEARAFLARVPGLGARLQGLDIDCRQSGRLDPAALESVWRDFDGKIGLYETEGFIQLANLGLDGRCAFPHDRFVVALERALAAHVRDRTIRNKLLTFVAHYQHEDGASDAALATLERAYAASPDNPIPLFLAAEWSVDRRDIGGARRYYARAQAAIGRSLADYSNFSKPLLKRIERHS